MFRDNYCVIQFENTCLWKDKISFQYLELLDVHVHVSLWQSVALTMLKHLLEFQWHEGILFYRGVQKRGGKVCQQLPADLVQPVNDGTREHQGHRLIGCPRNHQVLPTHRGHCSIYFTVAMSSILMQVLILDWHAI